MDKELFLKYLELTLTNLNAPRSLKFNIEAELTRVLRLYSAEEIAEKVKELTYKL